MKMREGSGHSVEPIWFVLGFLPVLMAATTWDYTPQTGNVVYAMRSAHAPVLLVEFAIFIYAMLKGFSVFRAMADLRPWEKLALGALMLIWVGTVALAAPQKGGAFAHTFADFIHVIFALSVFYLIRQGATHLSDGRLWWCVCAGATAYAALLIVFVANIPDPDRFDWVTFGLGVLNIRQIGFYSIVGGSAAIGLATISKDRGGFWGGVLIGAVMIAIDVWSGARGPLFAVIATTIVALALIPGLNWRRCLSALVLTLIAGIAGSRVHDAPSIFYGLERIIGSSAATQSIDGMTSGRIVTWMGTLRVLGESPLFGFGPAQFRSLVPESRDYSNPHNLIIQVLFDWGIVGGALFLALFGSLWLNFVVAARRRGVASAPAFMVANGLLCFSMYDVTAYYAYPIVMIIACMALVLGKDAQVRAGAQL